MFYSIIIPVFNCEGTLQRCIDSILNQTFRDFELLLIDDGSTDGSGSVCDLYETLDIRVSVIHKINGGVSSARNAGLMEAKGSFLVFVDADDFLESDYLLHLKDYCDKDRIVIGGYKVFFEDNTIIRVKQYEEYSIECTNKQALGNCYEKMDLDCVWGKSFCKDMIVGNKLLFDDQMSYGEDTKFVVDSLYYAKKLVFSPYSEYCHVKYKSRTLSSFQSFEDAIERIELESDKVCDSLTSLLGTNAEKHVLNKVGTRYANVFLEAISKPNMKKEHIKSFYRKKWFRKVLDNADDFFRNESMKFRWLLKTKSISLLLMYLSKRKRS